MKTPSPVSAPCVMRRVEGFLAVSPGRAQVQLFPALFRNLICSIGLF